MNREEEEYVPQRFFPQQVGILLQRLAAAPPPWGAAPEAARVQAGPARDALARALAAVPPLPAALLIEHKGDTQWLRYAHACAALLPWQHYWTSAEKPLVRDLVALVGTVLAAREEWAAAEEYLRGALSLAPLGDVARTLARVEAHQGDHAQSAGAVPQALRSYAQALVYDPGNPTYGQKLARVQALYAGERRRQRWAAGTRLVRRVALGGALVVYIEGGLWKTYRIEEGPQSPAMASQPARAPGAEAPIESAAATHASADAGNGVEQAHALELAEEPAGRAQEIAAPKEEEQRAEEQSPSLAEPLQRPAPSPGAPPAEEPRPPDVSPAVPDRAPQRGDSSAKKGAFGTPHPPRIIAASPSAPAVELTVGAVQTFAVHARASDKDSRLRYTWFLDGRPVARGPAWVFQAPAQPTADPGYHVTVEVADSGGGKARVRWELAVKLPSPLPRIVAAQPPTRTVVMEVGQALEFSVTAEGSGEGEEAPQGLSYHWQVDEAPVQTTPTPSFAFVATTATTHHLAVVAVSPAGFKSTPKGWLIEVHPAEESPPAS